jgi:hypothetical protein
MEYDYGKVVYYERQRERKGDKEEMTCQKYYFAANNKVYY